MKRARPRLLDHQGHVSPDIVSRSRPLAHRPTRPQGAPPRRATGTPHAIARISMLLALVPICIISLSCSNVDKDWEKATRANTVSALDRFLRNHPASPYAQDAHDRIARLWTDSAPLGVTCEVLSNLKVRVTWTQMTGAREYVVYRSNDSIPEGHVSHAHAHVDLPSFVEKADGDDFGRRLTLYYRIAAVRDEGTSRQSRVAAVHLLDSIAGTRCQLCGAPAKGFCHIRRIHVCEEHNVFLQDDGSYMRCP